MRDPRIIVALDFPEAGAALSLARRLEPERCRVKVGKELFTAAGPDVVTRLIDLGFDVFLDLKFHDIPNTVVGACRAACRLGVWMLNVHVSGGREMMRAARETVDASDTHPLLIGVTVLTSTADDALTEIGVSVSAAQQVLRLAQLAFDCGLDGVVCSAKEIELLRKNLPLEFRLVTPGIRPRGSDTHDQSRVMTPREAFDLGSSYLVIGRAITAAPDPLASLCAIEESLR